MNRRPLVGFGVAGLLVSLVGCGDQPPPKPLFPTTATGVTADGLPPGDPTGLPGDRDVLISSAVKLLETAATTPGAGSFGRATDYFNQYFAGTDAAEFAMSSAERAFVSPLGPDLVRPLDGREFTTPRDPRHIEDCMLYHAVATRVAGDGDDLTRVRRVFDWLVRHIILVPAGALAPPGGEQAMARPYDVLLRGLATETGTYWAERSWVFMALARQLGIDVALLTYTPPAGGEPVYWACAALVDGKPYLFDARAGLAIPGPGGRGVATLEEVIADPPILAGLSLPGQPPYPATAADLAATPLKVLFDSSFGYLAPRMRALEKELSGRNRLILFRDPSEQAAAFQAALGPRFGGAELWRLPVEVEVRLFTDAAFNLATQFAMKRFDSRYPLLASRIKQLRGDLVGDDGAIRHYGSFRLAENLLEADGKTVIPPDIQHDLNMDATYFLGLCQLEAEHPEQAEFLLGEVLRLVPEPGRGQPSFAYYRWGAQGNLAALLAARGETVRAVRLLCRETPTAQDRSHRLKARDLIWRDPFAPGPTATP